MNLDELEKLDKQIADCLSGSGDFNDLRRLQAQKADILDRDHFDTLQTIKDEIAALEAQRLTDFETEKALQFRLQDAAIEIDRQSEILFKARQAHAVIEGDLFFKRTAIENAKATVREKQVELAKLIDKKLNPDRYDEFGGFKKPLKEGQENERLRQIYFEK